LADREDQVRTLASLLERRQLSLEEALAWSSAVADDLAAVHQRGACHGAVGPEAVWIDAGNVHLGPGADLSPSASQTQDIVQFAALIRRMLSSVPPDQGDPRTRQALDRIAATNSKPAGDARMKKVASALGLLRLSAQVEASSRRSHTAEAVAAEESEPQQVLLLAREVPPASPPPRRRIRWTAVHAFAYFGCAAGVSAVLYLVLIAYLKFIH